MLPVPLLPRHQACLIRTYSIFIVMMPFHFITFASFRFYCQRHIPFTCTSHNSRMSIQITEIQYK